MNNSDTFLKKCDELLNVLSINLHMIWHTVPQDLADMSMDDIGHVRNFFIESGMQDSYDQLAFGRETYENFHYEVYSTLSSFSREKQEVYYRVLLMNFLENLRWYDSRIRFGYETYLKVIEWIRKNDNSEYNDNSEPFSEENFSRTMDGWEHMYTEIIEVISKLMSELTIVLADYLEADDIDVAQVKNELRDSRPAYARIILAEPTSDSKVLQSNDFVTKKSKETPTKDQVLLLHLLGILDMPNIKKLTTENKGILFARLLNRHEKNVTECIRNCDPMGNKHNEDNPYFYENKVNTANQLLKDVKFF